MEKEIQIDARMVLFRATAAVPRLYRIKFRRDIMQDMAQIQKSVEKAKETGGLPIASLEMFENVAYIMAKHADPKGVPDTVEAWLDGFDTFSVYQIFPELAALWTANAETMVSAKKKFSQAPGR